MSKPVFVLGTSMSNVLIKLNDLSGKIRNNSVRIQRGIERVLSRGWFVAGPELEAFEMSFASYLGAQHCLGVGNGTDAIELGLKAMGVRRGDVVATVANASMYTCTALQAIGAEPHFMDVEMATHVVSLNEVEKAIASGVKAVVGTHLYGLAMPEIKKIASLCRENQVLLFEDCAQAHGARVDGRCVGTFGDAAAFSFYPTKNLGSLGDGGAVVTSSEEIAHRLKSIRQYGWTSKYQVEHVGGRNSRLDEIQAAILNEFLPELDGLNEMRRSIASRYSRSIKHEKITVPTILDERFVAHLYVIQTSARDLLRAHLKLHGIQTEIHYPIPDYRQPVFDAKFKALSLQNTEQLSKTILTLPCYPEMPDADVDRVIDAIKGWAP